MKHTFYVLLGYLLLCGSAAAQNIPAQARIQKIDDFIASQDTVHNQVPDEQFATFVRQGQRFVSGNAVQEGKIVGNSAVISDKAITLNLGTNIIASRFSLQGTLQGVAKDGVVSLLKTGDYQHTLSAGVSGNVFLKGFGKGTFYWSTKTERMRLRQSLLYQRNQDQLANAQCPPDSVYAKQVRKYKKLATTLCSLRTAHPALLVARRKQVLNVCQDTAYYGQLSRVLVKLKQLQPPNWKTMDKMQEKAWLDSLCHPVNIDYVVGRAKIRTEAAAAKKQLARYDSILLSAKWSTRFILWANGGIAHNTTKLSQFVSNKPPAFQVSDWHNQTTSLTASLNGVVLRQHSRFYVSIGAQFLDRLNQLDDSLHTRFRTRPITALSPPVTVVDSVQAYRADVHLPNQWTVNGEISYYSLTSKVGIDATYKHYNPGLKNYAWTATLGVFFPILTGDATTVLLMPQVSYNTHDKFLFGASLAASVPGFFTKAENPGSPL